eukprot:2876539-Rhodomonas_salina.1
MVMAYGEAAGGIDDAFTAHMPPPKLCSKNLNPTPTRTPTHPPSPHAEEAGEPIRGNDGRPQRQKKRGES